MNVLFKFSTTPRGRNILAAAIYVRHGWHTLFLFPGSQRSIAIRLPVRALDLRPVLKAVA